MPIAVVMKTQQQNNKIEHRVDTAIDGCILDSKFSNQVCIVSILENCYVLLGLLESAKEP